MARVLVILICALGAAVLLGGIIAPLVGVVLALVAPETGSSVPVTVDNLGMLVRSICLAGVAMLGALVLGLGPAVLVGTVRGRALPIVWGGVLGPLLVPPQIYAYAWELVLGPSGWWSTLSAGTPLGHAVYAGLISAGWLWPVVALIVGAGWRSTGRATYALAILDVGPVRAWFQAVLPSLRNHVIAAGCVVGSLALIEYAIPHLTLARVYATELMLLVESAVDAKMIFQLSAQVFGLVLVLMIIALVHVRASARWELIRPQEDASLGDGSGSVIGRGAWIVTGAVWLITVGMPLAAMAFSLQRSDAWAEAFSLFARQWTVSLGVGAMTAVLSVAMAVATVGLARASGRSWPAWAAWAAFGPAVLPAAAVGVAFIAVFNRAGVPGYLYDHTPWVWVFALVARYGAVAVLVVWLAMGRRRMLLIEQARVDGAGTWDILAHVVLPMLRPMLVAAGLLVMLLSLFEVVVTQLVGPIGYPSIGLTVLNHMHYGRDDVVIATSLTVVAAWLAATLGCGWLLVQPERR